MKMQGIWRGLLTIVGLMAGVRVMAQAGCGCEPAGIRGVVNSTNGIWHGHLPFQTSPGVLDLTKVNAKYLNYEWFTEAEIDSSVSAGYASGTCWYADGGTEIITTHVQYSATRSKTMNRHGTTISDEYNGTQTDSSLLTDTRTNHWTCIPYKTWTSITNQWLTTETLSTGSPLGTGVWSVVDTSNLRSYEISPNTGWKLGGTTNSWAYNVSNIWEVVGSTTTASTSRTTITYYDDPPFNLTGEAATDETLGMPYTRLDFRDELASRLNPSGRQTNSLQVQCSFAIDGNLESGGIQKIESLQAYVVGEAGRTYSVWYRKTTRLKNGLFTSEEFSVPVVAQGPDVEAWANIPFDALPTGDTGIDSLPTGEGHIVYEFLRAEALNNASGDPAGGTPGIGTFSGVGSVGGTCAGCGSVGGPGSWGEWGGGTVGYGVTLGSALGGSRVGRIQAAVAGNRQALLARGSLKVSGYLGALEIRQDSGGLRQVWAPMSVADVQSLTNGGYEIKFYAWSAVTSTNGAYATFSSAASPQAIWRVEPDVSGILDGNRVRVTATTAGGDSKITQFIANTNAPAGQTSWTVVSPGGLFEHTTESWTENDSVYGNCIIERQAWKWPGVSTNSFVQTRKLAAFEWGMGVVESTVGEGTHARTTITEYWTGTTGRRPSGEVALTRGWDGSWEAYEYDSQGRLTATIQPDGMAEFGDPGVRRTEYSYTPVSGGGDAAFAAHVRIPRTVTEQIGGSVVARAWTIIKQGERRTIRGATADATFTTTTNLTSRQWHYPSGSPFAGRFWKKLSEDGILTLYAYSTNGFGRVTTVLTGSPAGSNPLTATNIVNGTEIVTVVGAYGEIVSQTSRWIDGGTAGATFESVAFSDFDEAKRWRRMDLLDGTYETRSFDCCGIGLAIDRDGVPTQLLYDAAGRHIGSTRLGISVTNLLNPAGAVVRAVRVGTNGSTNTLFTAGYDSAGSLRWMTNALGGVTTHSWTINGEGELEQSSIDPAGGTQTQRHYRDGGIRSITGSAVINRTFTSSVGNYYVDPGDSVTLYATATTETALDNDGYPKDSIVTIRDALGQVRRVDRGSSVRTWYSYNRKGQLVQEVDADGVTTLYRYSPEAELEYVAIDINPANTTWDSDGNPSIDFLQDRLTRQATDSTTYASQAVRRQRRWEYPTSGSTNAVEVRAAMVTPDARKAWTVDRGLTSANSLVMNRTQQTRTVTNTAPDGSWTVAIYTSGRLTANTAYTSTGTQVNRETYAYDPHSRVSHITDARNGTRTFGYNAADLMASESSPPSGTGDAARITLRQYSSAGRLTKITLPGGDQLNLSYAPNGLLTNRSGGRQPTVGYTYDHAGRLTTLTTWKNSTAQTGAKSTHWLYADSTGFLASRHLGGEAPIYYSYTAGGRPRSVLVNDAWGPGTQWQYGFDAAPPTRRTADVSQVQYTGTVDLDGQPATPDLEFSYDRAGRRIGATQITGGATNSTVSWTRNSFGLVTAETWTAGPLSGHTLAYTYDDRLRRTNLTFRVGATTNGVVGYTFDTAGRISWLGDGSSSATYTYAANASLVQQVQLRHGASVALTVSRQYDRWNRIHTQTAVGSASGVVGQEYTHNATGQRIRTQQLDGSYWLYEYDSLGQVKSAKRYWADGSPVAGQQFEYAHDDIGNRTTGKSGGDVVGGSLRTTTDTTDADSLLTQRSNPRQYEVQGAARIGTEVKVNGVVATRQGEYFRYEGTASGTAARWLDHSLSLNGSTLISGRKKYVPPQTESVGHDIVGNRIQDGRWEMAWDGENRLIDVRTRDAAVSEGVPKQRLRYTYDPDGRLIERRRFSWSAGDWVLSETTRYLNDGWQCVGEFNGSNTLQRRQVWGLDLDGSRGGMGGIGGLLWIASQANGTHYATSDGSGNVVGLFDTSGSISARYVYSPFGELLQLSGGAIAAENPWRFSSKRQDPTTDWIHYEYRIYDPMSGRWLSRDPIGEAGGENLYGFVGNDPVNQVDPDGRDPMTPRGNNQIPQLIFVWEPGGQLQQSYPPPDLLGEICTGVAVCGYEVTLGGLVDTITDLQEAMDEDKDPLLRWGGGLRAGGWGLLQVVPGVNACKKVCKLALTAPASRVSSASASIGGFVQGESSVVGSGVGLLELLPPGGGAGQGARVAQVGCQAGARGKPNVRTGVGYGVNDPPVRIQGTWTEADFKAALAGKPPAGLGRPDLHHADQMPGSAIHEVLPGVHRGNPALHPNACNQGVTDLMRAQDRQLHWWYRAREQGADQLYPDLIYKKRS